MNNLESNQKLIFKQVHFKEEILSFNQQSLRCYKYASELAEILGLGNPMTQFKYFKVLKQITDSACFIAFESAEIKKILKKYHKYITKHPESKTNIKPYSASKILQNVQNFEIQANSSLMWKRALFFRKIKQLHIYADIFVSRHVHGKHINTFWYGSYAYRAQRLIKALPALKNLRQIWIEGKLDTILRSLVNMIENISEKLNPKLKIAIQIEDDEVEGQPFKLVKPFEFSAKVNCLKFTEFTNCKMLRYVITNQADFKNLDTISFISADFKVKNTTSLQQLSQLKSVKELSFRLATSLENTSEDTPLIQYFSFPPNLQKLYLNLYDQINYTKFVGQINDNYDIIDPSKKVQSLIDNWSTLQNLQVLVLSLRVEQFEKSVIALTIALMNQVASLKEFSLFIDGPEFDRVADNKYSSSKYKGEKLEMAFFIKSLITKFQDLESMRIQAPEFSFKNYDIISNNSFRNLSKLQLTGGVLAENLGQFLSSMPNISEIFFHSIMFSSKSEIELFHVELKNLLKLNSFYASVSMKSTLDKKFYNQYLLTFLKMSPVNMVSINLNNFTLTKELLIIVGESLRERSSKKSIEIYQKGFRLSYQNGEYEVRR